MWGFKWCRKSVEHDGQKGTWQKSGQYFQNTCPFQPGLCFTLEQETGKQYRQKGSKGFKHRSTLAISGRLSSGNDFSVWWTGYFVSLGGGPLSSSLCGHQECDLPKCNEILWPAGPHALGAQHCFYECEMMDEALQPCDLLTW